MLMTVRDAYDHVFKREHDFATFKGLSLNEANRHANRMAVKYAWEQFHYLKKAKNNVKKLH